MKHSLNEIGKHRLKQYINKRILQEKTNLSTLDQELKQNPSSALSVIKDDIQSRIFRFETKLNTL